MAEETTVTRQEARAEAIACLRQAEVAGTPEWAAQRIAAARTWMDLAEHSPMA